MPRSLLPQRKNAEWNNESDFPRLQWRDRAGLTPDFPIKPLRAPKNSNEW